MNGQKVVIALLVCTVVASGSEKITFMSTQLVPIAEAEWVRSELLPRFTKETGIDVVFVGAGYGEFADRLVAEYKAGKGTIALAGGLHGDYTPLVRTLTDLSKEFADLQALGDRTFIPAFVELGRLNKIQAYIPWTQGTYLMVVNKMALDYLPEGVDIRALTYDDLLAWAKNIYEATGDKKLGIPAGPRSLLHRFVHGYLYPSFTGYQVIKFDSPEAIKMWRFVKELWQYVNPAVATWDAMDTPLLSGEVWIAWDHGARLKQAIIERPDDFIAIPAPAGPRGRGIITVLAGLAIPKASPNPEAATRLIEFLTRPQTQVIILKGVGFFPVVKEAIGTAPEGPLKVLADGVMAQASSKDLITAFIPSGLGPRSGEFSKIYRDTFVEIVVKRRPIREVLSRQGRLLKRLFQETGAPYPPPDESR